MTVSELIDELKRHPDNAIVAAVIPVYGGMDVDICEVEKVDLASWGKTVVQLHLEDSLIFKIRLRISTDTKQPTKKG